MIAAQQAENPGLATLGEGDGASTANGSRIGTPRASMPPGGTKLKLTFGGGANNGSVASGVE